jgi:hypothetical protein
MGDVISWFAAPGVWCDARFIHPMQPRRAASWLYDVINVLIDALDMEVSLLSRGNVSWRFYNQELEHIRPTISYLSRDSRHILRDLIAAKPAVDSLVTKHDELREHIEVTATVVYREGLDDPTLRRAVEEARKTFLEKFPNAVPTGAFAAEQHVDLVIEHLVNEIKELPLHHTDAEFWAAHRNAFAVFDVPSFAVLRQLRGEFLKFDQTSIKWLEDLSLQICTEHDIPAAPSVAVGY